MDELRRQMYDHEGRIARLESWQQSEESGKAHAPSWVSIAVAVLFGLAGLATTLLNLWRGP